MWLVVRVTVCTSVSTSTNKHPALLHDVHGRVRCSCEVMHPYSERVDRQSDKRGTPASLEADLLRLRRRKMGENVGALDADQAEN